MPQNDYLDRTWIVTQGPMDTTISDFWRLIWQENTRMIIMLTKTFEVVRLMCSQYWPLHVKSREKYGDFTVVLQKEENYAHYKVRHFVLEFNHEKRTVTQFHYMSWPLSAQPDSANLLLFRRHIWSVMKETDNAGPPIVHCHDGGGRSGTFLAIEANLSMADSLNEVDSKLHQILFEISKVLKTMPVFSVFRSVKWLHKQRAQLVTHPGFYRLIYDVIEDYIRCGNTCVTLEDMLTHNICEQRNKEFQTLASLRPQYTIGDCAAGHRAENREKNRNVMVVPPDDNRPYLTSFQSNSTTDYINAVFVDGFCQAKAMIVTEWPMQSTVGRCNFLIGISFKDLHMLIFFQPISGQWCTIMIVQRWSYSIILQVQEKSPEVIKVLSDFGQTKIMPPTDQFFQFKPLTSWFSLTFRFGNFDLAKKKLLLTENFKYNPWMKRNHKKIITTFHCPPCFFKASKLRQSW